MEGRKAGFVVISHNITRSFQVPAALIDETGISLIEASVMPFAAGPGTYI